jgi:diguanylate cyclase (GGDEF)-like protein
MIGSEMMKKLKTIFKNVLQSGFTFSEEEHELRSKFILINSMFSIGILLISLLTVFLFLNGKILFASTNSFFLLVVIVLLLLMRRSKNAYKTIVPFVVLIDVTLAAIALSIFPDEQVRISWFIIAIIFSFFLGGRWLGIATTLLSILTIFAIDQYIGLNLDNYVFFLALSIILLAAVFVDLYEQRSRRTKMILRDINKNLEKRIKEETLKRIKLYKRNNQKLLKSSEKLREQKAVYQHLSHYDALTDLPNRVLFYGRLEHAIDEAKSHHAKLAVLFIDLDHFKEINDSLGHQLGDEFLKVIAERLQEKLHGSDHIARLGGDEFAIYVENIKDNFEIVDIALELIRVLKEPAVVENHMLYPTGSIGISVYPETAKRWRRC